MENEWIVIEVIVPGTLVDMATAVLYAADCRGIVVDERQLDTFVAPDEELDPQANYRLKAYFEAPEDTQHFFHELAATLNEAPVLAGKCSLVPPQSVRLEDWAENWKQNFPRMKIGQHLIIRPSWEEYSPRPGEVVVEIDPGMAFGTGSHGTTLLCLETIAELFDRPHPPQSFLDVGTGSGILALAAAVLGCPRVVANDIDPVACQVARENASKNRLVEQLEITQTPLEDLPGTYDLVVANILAEENVRLKNALLDHLRPGGWLVLSGILREKEDLVAKGFADLPLRSWPSRHRDDWVCLLYQRDS